jgi:hypothetical protein
MSIEEKQKRLKEEIETMEITKQPGHETGEGFQGVKLKRNDQCRRKQVRLDAVKAINAFGTYAVFQDFHVMKSLENGIPGSI